MSRPRRSPEAVAESRAASKARSRERALAAGLRANGSPRTTGTPGRKPLTPEQEAARRSLRAVWAALDAARPLAERTGAGMVVADAAPSPTLLAAVADAEARARAVGLTWTVRDDGRRGEVLAVSNA